jgi:hypothetical protein
MYVDNASSNGKQPQGDVARAVGELGKHFIGKWSGLGDYFKALDVAGPVLARRMQPRPQLGASSAFLTLAKRIVSPPTAPRPAVNVISTTRQVLQSPPKPSILTPAIQVVSQPITPVSSPSAPSVDPYYNAPLSQPASGGNGGVPSPPVEIGTLDVSGDSSGNPLAGLSSNSPLLLLLAAAAFYFLDGKPKKRRRR